MRDGIDARRLPHAARLLLPRALDSRHRLVSRLSAAALRSPRRPLQRQARARVGRTDDRAGRERCSTTSSTTPIATSRITSRASITTRRSPPRSGSPRAGGPTRSRSPCIRRRRSCATTSFAAAFATGRAGFLISILNSYYVFLKILKLWELQRGYRTPGPATRPAPSSARRRPKFARTPNVEADRSEAVPEPRSRDDPPGAPVHRRRPHPQ